MNILLELKKYLEQHEKMLGNQPPGFSKRYATPTPCGDSDAETYLQTDAYIKAYKETEILMSDMQLWGGILSMLIALVVWVLRSTTSRIEAVEGKNVEYRLEMDDLFLRKSDYRDDLVRLEKKIDRIVDTLIKR
jgi:hypothetical protein